MTTTVSIDTVGSTFDAVSAANAAAGRGRGSDFQVASGEAISLFQRSFAQQTAENAALDETMRAALVSVSETLTKVDAAADKAETTVNAASPAIVDAATAPVDAFVSNASVVEGTVRSDAIGTIASTETSTVQLPALPQQIASNAALETDLTAASALVGETLTQVNAAATEAQTTVNATNPMIVDAATAPVDAFVSNASVVEGTVRSDAIGTIASTETTSSTVQFPALPQQIASNATLATDLTAATAAAGETLAQVNAAAVPVDAFVSNASVVEGTVRSDAIGTIASTETTSSTVQLPALPQQIASNAALETDLTAASAAVGETLAQVNAAATEAQATVNATNPTIVDAAAVPVDAFVSNASVVEGTVRSDAIGTIESTEDDAAISVSDETPQTAADIPEATADALVAAGVAPQVVSAAGVAPVQTPTVVASVDAVATAAATPTADVLIQAASAVADTLLVSPGLLRGQGEVIVQLRPDVLDGTEVKISVIGRQLEVVFQPQTVDMAVLIENCRSQLTQHLAAKIASFNVSVDVRKKRESA